MAKKIVKREKTHLETATDKIGEIAVHYGFTVVKPPQVTSDDVHKVKHFKEFDYYEDSLEKIALTRWYMEGRLDLESQPLTVHYKKPLHGHTIKHKNNTEIYGFEIMGSSKSTSEALLLKCAVSILEDCGYKNLCIDINSIGDRESVSRFERDLNTHFRKHGGALSAKARKDFKKNHYSILTNPTNDTKDFRASAPQPLGSLSEASRLHFKEVLESVETFNVTYKIKPSLLSNKLFAAGTTFEIRQMSDKADEDGELLAYGYRYNHLAKKIGGKREIPSVGITIFVKRNPLTTKKVIIKNIKKPRFYLVQLGATAKLKALNIVEMLRKQKISVYHSITKDKITGQLSGAEYMKATHVLIMGQKEAIENSMVVRSIANREQETVLLSELGDYLKNLDKKKKARA